MTKAILKIEFDDEWLNRINKTCDEMFADVTIYMKESLKNQCDYSQRLYRCWCPVKPIPKNDFIAEAESYQTEAEYKAYVRGWKDCIDEIVGGNYED